MLCLLAVWHSQEIEQSRYGGGDSLFFVYEFRTRSVYGVPPLCANKRFESSSGVMVVVTGREVRWLQDIQFESIASCEAEWLK